MQNLAKSPQSAQIALRPLKIHPKRPKSLPNPSQNTSQTLPKSFKNHNFIENFNCAL